MLYLTLILLVDALHNQFDKHRGFVAETLEVYLLRVVRTVHSLAVMEKIGHLNAQKQRLFRKFDIERVVAPIIGDY